MQEIVSRSCSHVVRRVCSFDTPDLARALTLYFPYTVFSCCAMCFLDMDMDYEKVKCAQAGTGADSTESPANAMRGKDRDILSENPSVCRSVTENRSAGSVQWHTTYDVRRTDYNTCHYTSALKKKPTKASLSGSQATDGIGTKYLYLCFPMGLQKSHILFSRNRSMYVWHPF